MEDIICKNIKDILVEYGAMQKDWNIKIINISPLNIRSDFSIITVYIYKKRSRKPDFSFELYADMNHGTIDFSKSKHYNLK